MPGQSGLNQQTITYLIVGVIVVALLAFRIMRARKARPVKLNLLWVGPAIILVVFGFFTAMMIYLGGPMSLTTGAALAASLVVGAAIGWWRGRFTRLEVNAETGSVTAQATGMGFVVLFGIIGARFALRYLFLGNLDPRAPLSMQINAGFLLFAIGLLCVASLEMWVRAKKLLAQARGEAGPG